jgi:toxin ParE1/3/4
MKVLVSEKAKRDLLRIYSYFEQRNPSAAEATLRRIDERFGQLSDFPFIGRERSSLAPGLRSLVAGNHLIFYVVGRDAITVVRVIDGRMDIDEEFRR